MALLVAHVGFNIDEINLNFYVNNYYGSDLLTDANISIGGEIYPDYYWVNGYNGIDNLQLDILGSDITTNSAGDIIGGTVNFIDEREYGGQRVYWFAQDISVSAVAIYNAALTPSNTDELSLIASAFSGNDYIFLSSFDDRMNGYNGKDLIAGNGGNDILDGGPGIDTAGYVDSIDDCTITFDGPTLIISGPISGTDHLTSFEFVAFSNGEDLRSVSSLSDLTKPVIASASPSDGATDAAVDSNVTLTFSEAIQRGSGIIYLRSGSDTGTIIEQFDAVGSARLTVSGSDLTINPTADLQGGTHYFVIFDKGTVKDLAGNKFSGTQTYDFMTTNQPPTGTSPQAISTNEDTPKAGAATITDVDNVTLTYDIAAPAPHGILVLAMDGSFQYVPAANYNGPDSFSIKGTDAGGLSFTQVFNLTVTPVNDAPVFQPSILEFATTANTPKSFAVSATDADGNALSYSANDPAHGAVTGGAGGQFTYTPDNGYTGIDTVTVTVSDGNGGSAQQSYVVTVNPAAATQTEWNLLTTTGFAGAIGGSGKVFGGAGFQDVRVADLPGTVVLDGSFNQGGDIVRLHGNAAGWQVKTLGSAALFTDGDTFVQVPAGTTGMTVVFDDGVRLLRIDTVAQTLKIGAQAFANSYVQVTAPSDGSPLPAGADPAASGQLLLMPGGEVAAGGKLSIFGTGTGHETVHLLPGNATLDGSFNQGGDTLLLDPPATSFMASQLGSQVFLDGASTDVRIPAGTAGMTLEFAGGDDRTLRIDLGIPAMVVDTQQIGLIPIALSAFA